MSLNLAIASLSEGDFNIILKNGVRSSSIYGIEFESLRFSSYSFVKRDLPELLSKGDFDGVILAAVKDRGVGMFTCDVDLIPPKESMSFILWISDELKRINEMESNNLQSETDAELLSAGINEMTIFGELNTVDALAGGDITKHDAVWKMRYCDVFDKQLKNIYESRINKRVLKNRQSNKKPK